MVVWPQIGTEIINPSKNKIPKFDISLDYHPERHGCKFLIPMLPEHL